LSICQEKRKPEKTRGSGQAHSWVFLRGVMNSRGDVRTGGVGLNPSLKEWEKKQGKQNSKGWINQANEPKSRRGIVTP